MRSPHGPPQSYSLGNSSVRAVPPAGRVSSSGGVDAWAAADPDIQRQTYYDKDTYMFPDSMRPKKSEGALPNYLELHKKSLLVGAVRPDHREAAGSKVIGTERAVQDACQLVQEIHKYQKHKTTYTLPDYVDTKGVKNIPMHAVHRIDTIVQNREREEELRRQME